MVIKRSRDVFYQLIIMKMSKNVLDHVLTLKRENKMEQEIVESLKQQAIQLYIDKIQINDFTAYLYSDEVLEFIDSESFVFDLVEINFNDEKWRSQLERVLLKTISKEESTCLKLYTYSRIIRHTDDFKKLQEVICKITELIDWDNTIDFVFEFYKMVDEIEEWQFYFSSKEEMELKITFWSKDNAELFIEGYKHCKTEQDFEELLYGVDLETLNEPFRHENKFHNNEIAGIPNHSIPECFKNIKKHERAHYLDKKEEFTRSFLMCSFIGFVSTFVGIIGLEKGKFMYAFLVIGIGVLVTSLYYLVLLIGVNKNIKQTLLRVSV